MFVLFDKHSRVVRMVILTWRPGQQDGEQESMEDEGAARTEDDEEWGSELTRLDADWCRRGR